MNYEDLEGEFLQYASIVKLTEGQEMTPADLNAAITAIRAGVGIFKASSNLKDAESIRIITSVERELSKLDLELSNLETELASKNRELIAKDKEIAQLKEQLAKPKTTPKILKLSVMNESYWYSQTDVDNPVCSACYDSLDKIVRLVPTDRSTKMSTKHKYQCPNCKTTS